ncbi:MAG TPA: heterodisulfide reductase subunit F [Dehalococcoidia bacterium]|jgi:NAD(P)H-flavin reductase|nr:FAD/NAD(P)-binding protein [SAR202 cluster bacterium]MDP6799184.1 FAD/NAD(P)-binding protein [SAR202 cluster bacterium]HAL48586.1 heterodisulfide reductase subunit F [Dehalococcoidia bacterium]|tara:strand:- start:4329 stop:5174 length:846 start_codon:yes stop_codon:yes gene_type:complete
MNDSTANPFMPHLMRIAESRDETLDVRTLRLEFIDPEAASEMEWQAGQFGQFSIFGTGECVFTITNPPNRGDHIECTFRDVGKATNALRSRSVGQTVGFRGPYGNWFDMEGWQGKDILFVGGGIGMAALHAPLQFVLDHRDDYGEILVLNGARTVADIVYGDEMNEWQEMDRVKVVQTVDPGGETSEWTREVGLIPNVFEQLDPKPNGNIVVTCGPPIMIHFMMITLDKLGFPPEQVITTLENKMKCGIGHCGRCNVGRLLVCRDGPVVTAAQLKDLPAEL